MTLSVGTRLGPYEILRAIGAGGMGEVYRARDTRLGRDVAVKVVPEELAASPTRLSRFEHEARATAALSHPNILVVHDVGVEGSVHYVVEELLEGESLREMLSKGPLAVSKAVEYASQIAHGLDVAHQKGIVHRDLKPANLFITKAGPLKILDFGLARLTQPLSAESHSAVPTLTKDTDSGLVLGTVPYMSPEQARGEAVDGRSDIFSLGVVLYEMVSGRRAFARPSKVETLHAILSEDPPDLSGMGIPVPAPLDRLMRRCLEKRPEARFQSAHDLALALEVASASGSGVTTVATMGRTRGNVSMRRVGLLVPLVVGLGFGFLAAWARLRGASTAPVIRSIVKLEPGYWLDGVRTPSPWGFEQPSRTAMALSHDGRFVVYSAVRENPPLEVKPQLYLRRMDQLEARRIPGTEGGISPFLSPDDRWVGFWADGKLLKAPVDGGLAVTLCDAATLLGASWGPGGTIVFSPSPDSGLFRVPAEGGKTETLTTPNKTTGETSHRLPHWLPDGKGLLFTVMRETASEFEPRVALLDMKARTWRVLVEDGADARYLKTGHLLFLRRGNLMVVPFDLGRPDLVGQPLPTIAGVVQTMNCGGGDTAAGQFSISDSGDLLYVPGGILPDIDSTLEWVDPKGNEELAAPMKAWFFCPRLSPDGQKLAYINWGRFRAWVYDLARGTNTPLTDDGRTWSLTWTPDSKRIVLNWSKPGFPSALYWLSADGSSPKERLTTSPNWQWLGSVSPDGTTLAFTESGPGVGFNIVLMDLQSRGVTTLKGSKASEKANESSPTFSPAGRWLAYSSDESGKSEVYVRPFPPSHAGKWQISADGGSQPLWTRNGKRLFYRSGGRDEEEVWVVDLSTGTQFSAGKPRLLFKHKREFQGGATPCWDVSLDGERLLMAKLDERRPTPITEMILVHNWFQELKRLALE